MLYSKLRTQFKPHTHFPLVCVEITMTVNVLWVYVCVCVFLCVACFSGPDNKNYDDKATALIYLMYLEQWFLFTIFTFGIGGEKNEEKKDMVAQWKRVHRTIEGHTIACYRNTYSSDETKKRRKNLNESEQTNAAQNRNEQNVHI